MAGTISFQGTQDRCRWVGLTFTPEDIDEIAVDVTGRALDLRHTVAVEERLRDLASTNMASEFLEEFLADAGQEDVLSWQVGEAIAEVVLESDHGVVFPWNSRRDERNPRASLPGADLVGFAADDTGTWFLFGEVKSSSDNQSPPGVMYGKSGMVDQLERLVGNTRLQLTLLKWLAARCPTDVLAELFDAAATRFLMSQGSDIRIFGVLVRDTPPRATDIEARARNFAPIVNEPGAATFIACYLPLPYDRWTEWMAA